MNFLRVARSRFETPPRKDDSLATQLSAFLNAFAAEINFGQIQIRFSVAVTQEGTDELRLKFAERNDVIHIRRRCAW
jgi:hypothetical protein